MGRERPASNPKHRPTGSGGAPGRGRVDGSGSEGRRPERTGLQWRESREGSIPSRGGPRSSAPGRGRGQESGRPARSDSGPPRPHLEIPDIPDDVVAADLDRAARGRLRTLSKDNADGVARHLVMAGRLLDTDPEEAYRHAQAAVRRAGRVDVVREAAGITAYRTGRYAEALRELRTVRRLNGSDEHVPLMADCERGLGRPERAIALANEESARSLPADIRAELAIVVSGARLDLGEPEAAVAVLRNLTGRVTREQSDRVTSALVDALEAAGRREDAARLRQGLPHDDEELVVYDLEPDVAIAGTESDGAEIGEAATRNDQSVDTPGETALPEPAADVAPVDAGPSVADQERGKA